jgi:hypothetical protein
MILRRAAAPHWVCMKCQKTIRPGDGAIEIFNANPELGPVGRYPVEASPDSDPQTETDAFRVATDPDVATRQEMTLAQVNEAIWHLDRPRNIDFAVYHGRCAPASKGAYYIHVARAATMEGWVAWALHLSRKNWMGMWDLQRMLRFWWSHKRAEAPPL